MLWQDYGALLRTHRENNADITIATHSVGWKQASLRGITRVDPDGDSPSPLQQTSSASVLWSWRAPSASSREESTKDAG